ncbi:MAG: RnfABCDGE type electron transport complex subunit B [Rhodocyclaceae bacterium]|jgi:electron transport complex protein RnfB|nr:RnfABCDGE type electron transport complex subunit B [Rhodocyclaceae bacterium]
MLAAVASLSVLGASLGLGLGIAARRFHVEADAVVAELEAMMPGSQCGQCGFPGCAGAAQALADGKAPVTVCPPGGKTLAQALADKLGISADLSGMGEVVPMVAGVREEICIGCTKCFKACPTDAIHGAVKQIHGVLKEACTGCAKCVDVCPTEALSLSPVPLTLQSWAWHRPQPATLNA